VDGRPQRIKAPRGDAELVKRALTTALFTHYDVDSLNQLNSVISDDSATTSKERSSLSSDIELDDTIDPLVTPDDEDDVETLSESDGIGDVSTDAGMKAAGSDTAADASDAGNSGVSGEDTRDTEEGDTEPTATEQTAGTASAASEGRDPPRAESEIDPEDIEAMKARLTTLTKVAKRQNKLLKQQQETITQLVEELKRQRE